MKDIERIYMMKKQESNPRVDNVTMIVRTIEHGKGGRVEVISIIPYGVTRSSMRTDEYDSLDEVRLLMETPNTEFNFGNGESPQCASRQAVLAWADKFSHFDIEKMFS